MRRSLVGKVYDQLTVVRLLEQRDHRYHQRYLCVCSCGKEVEVRESSLVNYSTRSCGHLRQGRKDDEEYYRWVSHLRNGLTIREVQEHMAKMGYIRSVQQTKQSLAKAGISTRVAKRGSAVRLEQFIANAGPRPNLKELAAQLKDRGIKCSYGGLLAAAHRLGVETQGRHPA